MSVFQPALAAQIQAAENYVGAVNRSLLERARDTISIMDFIPSKAMRDRILNRTSTAADDVSAYYTDFRNAIAGKTGNIPAGLYWVRKSLILKSNTTLFIDPRATIMADAPNWVPGSTYGFFITNENYASATPLIDNDIAVYGGEFNYNGLSIPGGGAHCIAFRNVNRPRVFNVKLFTGENLTAYLKCRDGITAWNYGETLTNAGIDNWDSTGSAIHLGNTIRDVTAQALQCTAGGSVVGSTGSSSTNYFIGNKVFGARNGTSHSASGIIFNNITVNPSDISRCVSANNYFEDCDLGYVVEGGGYGCVSIGDEFYRVDQQVIVIKATASSAPNGARCINPTLVDCSHSGANVAMIAVNGTNCSVENVRVINTALVPVAYALIGWFPAASVNGYISVLNAASGTGGFRFQNNGTNCKIVDLNPVNNRLEYNFKVSTAAGSAFENGLAMASPPTGLGAFRDLNAPTTINGAGGFETQTTAFGAGSGSKVVGLDNPGLGSELAIGTRQNNAAFTEALRIDYRNYVGIGTSTPTRKLDINDNGIRIRTAQTPANSTVAGNQGEICWDANYVYVCIAANTWRRSGIMSVF